MARKLKNPDKEQAERFKETARKAEADESGKEFDRAFNKIISAKHPARENRTPPKKQRGH